MSAQAETTETLKETLKRLSRDYNVPISSIRLKIAKPDAHLSFTVMNESNGVGTLTLKKALGLGAMEILKETLIRSTLNRCMTYLSGQAKAPIDKIDLRIYTKTEDVVNPTGYLFNNGKAVRPVSMDEIFNII
jgi:hypothetical protein